MHTDKYSNECIDGMPSLETCRARQRAAMDGRCHCGRKRDPDERVRQAGSRRWIVCLRCFGTIKQLS